MLQSANPTKTETKTVSSVENDKNIDMHKKAAAHLEEASKHHLDAAKHHSSGAHEKAAISTVEAQGHQCLANECHKEDIKHHALNHKATV
jgi:hypothetical protein